MAGIKLPWNDPSLDATHNDISGTMIKVEISQKDAETLKVINKLTKSNNRQIAFQATKAAIREQLMIIEASYDQETLQKVYEDIREEK